MKLFKLMITVICAASLATSCESFFDQTPDNMLDADDN